MEEDRPLLAFALSLAAALLMFVETFVFLLASSVASDLGLFGASDLLGGLAALALLFGVLVGLFAVLLYRNPEHHTGYGVVILVLSLGSVFAGGGFFLGTLLGVVGGILAIVFDSTEDDEVSFDPAGLGAPMPRGPRATPTAARPTRADVCENCRLSLPIGATRCPTCETPVPGAAGSPVAG